MASAASVLASLTPATTAPPRSSTHRGLVDVLLDSQCSLEGAPHEASNRSWGSLVAEFDQKGLRGQVGFLESSDGEVVVAASVKGTVKGEAFVWKVYSTPVAPYEACVPENYGAELLDLSNAHGLLEGESVVGVGRLELWRLLDRPLVLKSLLTLRVVCAALTPATPSPATTYTARFVAALAGTMFFRQVELQPAAVTGVRINLVGVSPHVAPPLTLNWRLFARKHESEGESLQHMRDGCSSLAPFPGTLVHEALQPIPLHGHGARHTRHYQLERLPDLNALTRKGTVYVVVYDGERVVACSRLTRPRPRRASAIFRPYVGGVRRGGNGGVAGIVELYQVSPLDPVKLTINLTVSGGDAAAFGIDNFASSDRFSCSGLSRRFYEPWGVDLDLTPVPRQGTKDLYPAGDLSGKFGTLQGLAVAVATLVDPTITLFGKHSVLGRAVAVYDPEWRVLGCADLVAEGRQLRASAYFTGNITGELRLSQSADSLFSETTVYMRLHHSGGPDTAGHLWHVHERDAKRGNDCTFVGDHFDPFAISLGDRAQGGGGHRGRPEPPARSTPGGGPEREARTPGHPGALDSARRLERGATPVDG
ncbi:hypothetical protein O3P69_003064 [Scylla paramamosain]|uniref:Uncharacterized protein n=1 Tax=Scylla paramamosain TaxID=85552 RepID=A0AAW0UJ09_SCYPA